MKALNRRDGEGIDEQRCSFGMRRRSDERMEKGK